mmetsp:Transcript_32746/g.82528  ORF Transcript_32746/g.82528 Transcript_32746/m.82528 type:complete len:92 (-) Transcript_32746:272-547(-)
MPPSGKASAAGKLIPQSCYAQDIALSCKAASDQRQGKSEALEVGNQPMAHTPHPRGEYQFTIHFGLDGPERLLLQRMPRFNWMTLPSSSGQ